MQREMAVMAQISLLFRKEEIDFVNLNKAPVIIQHQVIKNGDLIYENDEQTLIEFVKKVLTFFYDEKIRSERFYEIYEAALKEEYEDER
ncbi:MAG: nucleotidyltransferase domain-containing protein [Halanaerobiales bacterium]